MNKKYLKVEIMQDFIYIPVFLLVTWFAVEQGLVGNPEVLKEMLFIGAIAGAISTFISYRINKKRK